MASQRKKDRILEEVYGDDYDFFAWDENIKGEEYWDEPQFDEYNDDEEEDEYENQKPGQNQIYPCSQKGF